MESIDKGSCQLWKESLGTNTWAQTQAQRSQEQQEWVLLHQEQEVPAAQYTAVHPNASGLA